MTIGAEPRTRPTIQALRVAAADCRACPLWQRATQTVFGAGDAHAPLILVGEQPGDEEDRQGKPFVGPAGRLLDQALEAAQIERARTYVTNAVKHFKWSPSEGRGKRRLHEKPNANELRACRPWLLAELEAIRPKVVVCLGATAAPAAPGGWRTRKPFDRKWSSAWERRRRVRCWEMPFGSPSSAARS